MFDNAEEDISDVYTVAQGLIEMAYAKGLIQICDKKHTYKVDSIAFHQDGRIELQIGDQKDGPRD